MSSWPSSLGFQTRRLTLRTPVQQDDPATMAYLTDPKTMHYIPILLEQPWNIERVAARREARAYDESKRQARNFTILYKDGGEKGSTVIGQAGYRTLWMEQEKRGEMGIILDQAYHGRGLVWDVHLVLLTYGFEQLGLESVEWVTGKGNEGMRTVLRKMGCEDIGAEEGDPEWGPQVKYVLHIGHWPGVKTQLTERVDRCVEKEGARHNLVTSRPDG